MFSVFPGYSPRLNPRQPSDFLYRRIPSPREWNFLVKMTAEIEGGGADERFYASNFRETILHLYDHRFNPRDLQKFLTVTFSTRNRRPDRLYLNPSHNSRKLSEKDPQSEDPLLTLYLARQQMPAQLEESWDVRWGELRDYSQCPTTSLISYLKRASSLSFMLLPAQPTRLTELPPGLEFLLPEKGPEILQAIGEDPAGCRVGPVQIGGDNWGDTGKVKPGLRYSQTYGFREYGFSISDDRDCVVAHLGENLLQTAFSYIVPPYEDIVRGPLDVEEFPEALANEGFADCLNATMEDALNSKITFFRAERAPVPNAPAEPIVGVTIAPEALRKYYAGHPNWNHLCLSYPTPVNAQEARRELNEYLHSEPESGAMVTGYARGGGKDYLTLFLGDPTTGQNAVAEFFDLHRYSSSIGKDWQITVLVDIPHEPTKF